ncbi:carbohydrate ABC transporter permease [Falsarthrobacter nasiphocae]|uniref:Sn-glycerol 3-phosphate transport system permease protein n=1 Tax=Falsarthrobacter nasiphocae TaxID=189863 RepID=A0AAE3YHS7_9MICC|nr:carbohydrate ABC transporter permease [Falsarthrobacter nasiphocae]MDR6892542.1 sn-glycerol 3-phosphate transport system permease protein [Falsarthrobacter nasiphocae]
MSRSARMAAPSRTPGLVGTYLALGLAVLIIVLPLLIMVFGSFMPAKDIVTLMPHLLPSEWTMDNYRKVSGHVPLGRLLLNSLAVTAIGTAIKVFLALTTAYALVFINVRFKGVIFALILVALMVPPQVSMLPNYQLISSMGGVNTLWGIILPGLGTAFGTFLLRQQFLSIPASVMEAAELDGASHLRRLFQIAAPVSLPTIATVTLVTLVNEWNDYLWPLVITNDPQNMTLPVGLAYLQSAESSAGGYGILMAGAVLVIVPVLVVFTLLQRNIVAGLTRGSVTG